MSSELDQTLHTPLLGILPEEADLEAGEAVVAPVPKNVDEETQEDEEIEFSRFDNFISMILLPGLLFAQFYLAFGAHVKGCELLNLTQVGWVICVFVVSATLFRRVCIEQKIHSFAILLLPEVCMDFVLGLVLFHKVEAAFLTMLYCKLAFSLVVIFSCLRKLFCRSVETSEA